MTIRAFPETDLAAGDPYAMRAYLAEPDGTRAAEPGTPMTFVATTEGIKRDGLDLRIAGLDFTNFERNPVFLWVHNYSQPPLGKVTKIRRLKKRVEMTVVFDQGDEFAVEIERKYREGFLTAVSIGWIILDFEREVDKEGNTRIVVTGSDLLDLSAVPVPGDPEALLPSREIAAMRSLALFSRERDTTAKEALGESIRSKLDGPYLGEPETTEISTVLLRDIADQLGATVTYTEYGATVARKVEIVEEVSNECSHLGDDGEADWTRTATEMVRLFVDGAESIEEAQETYRHLQRHYRKLGKTPPELLEAGRLEAIEIRSLFLEGEWSIYHGGRMDEATSRLRDAAEKMRTAAEDLLDVIADDVEETVEDDGANRTALASIRDALPSNDSESEDGDNAS